MAGNILNPLTVRVRFWHPDRFLEWTLLVGKLARRLARRRAVDDRGAAGIVLCAQHWQELRENAADQHSATDNILIWL